MIPFLHRPLVQALLDGVAAVTAAAPPTQAPEVDPACAARALRGKPRAPERPPDVLFFEAEPAASNGRVQRMGQLLGGQLCVEIEDTFTQPERRAAEQQLHAVLDRLEQRLGAGSALAPLGALVRSVLVVKPPLFASHPSLLGMVVLGPQPYLDEVDLTTLLLHELVHQAIFLHDMLDPLFQPLARARMPLAYNPLLDTARPLDMCFHAAFVAYAVARLYAEAGRSADAATLLEPLGPCLRALADGSSALTSRGKAYLGWLEQRHACEAWMKRALRQPMPGAGAVQRARSYSALHR
jgi:hypothetical protein